MLMETIKANRVLHPIARNIKKAGVFFWSGINKEPHTKVCENMEKYKDIHSGRRCFIVATGPSLTMQDLDLIKGEFSFSMNSIINLYDRTGYRPTYYLIQDGNVERKLHEKLKCDYHKVSFMGIGDINGFKPVLGKNQALCYSERFEFYNLKVAYHIFETCYSDPMDIHMEFSDDCAKGIYDGCTVTYSAIQLACYMGFKEIYLLGCDTNYSGHADDSIAKGKNKKTTEPAFAMINAYKKAKEYADNHDIKIFNATRGGMLEVFPRVNLEDIINKEEI